MNTTPHEKSKQKNGEFIPNFTQYPNEILDNWMPHLTGTQVKIVNCFVRQIYGYHRQESKLSVRLIHEITGIAHSKVFDNLKKLIKIGCIQITKKGNRSNPHTYKIINITDRIPKREYNNEEEDTPQKETQLSLKGNTGIPYKETHVYPKGEQLNKEINIKEIVKERELLGNPEQFGKTEQPQTHYEDPIIEELSKDSDFEKLIKSLDALNTNIGDEKRLATISREQEINSHYSNEIAKVEQEYNLQRDINIPKLSIGSLLEASEEFLRRVGIGFDNNPRRILNLIYNQLPKDFVIKEDSKDVEILGDMIKKYMASRQDERESIAKRIYQSVEAMLKIYVIKKYGEPYREVLYPEILRSNLVLYLNCNPTFKYCLGGFSNDIDGVYTEVCRLAEKEARKKVDAIKIEHSKKIRQLEANRQAEIRSMFSESEISDFQKRNDDILRRMDSKGDIEDMPLNKPIQANLTEEEKQELNMLFVKGDKSSEDVIRMNFLIRKSRK